MEQISSAITFTLIFLAATESLILLRAKRNSIEVNESLTSLFIGGTKTIFYGALAAIAAPQILEVVTLIKSFNSPWPFRIFELNQTWIYWICLFLLCDFTHYWEHRLKHKSNWFWANHLVHHSARFYNLSVALRLGWTGVLTGGVIFYFALVLFGFRPVDVAFIVLVQKVYQFFTHIDWCPRLGILESFLVTPTHHRVHHACNSEYLDKNFGGVFIIFDRIFGTFAVETTPLRIGLVEPLRSNNPFFVLVSGWMRLIARLNMCRDWREAAYCLFASPNQFAGTKRFLMAERGKAEP